MDAAGELDGHPTDDGEVPFAHDFESANDRRGETTEEDESSVARELRTPPSSR
jgi:hypothetical protein